ncbi:hypothetical protein HWV62_44462 [Athelia sp. TMB]|nr:hypothetical protein HWV62_44462 [Athelia sp. TMB]
MMYIATGSKRLISTTSRHGYQRRNMTTPFMVGAVVILSGTLLAARSTIHLDATFQQNTVEFQADPATQIEFPTTLVIPSKSPLPKFSLVGLGVRTVSFLGVKVYSVGFYADLSNPRLQIHRSASFAEKMDHIARNTAHLRDAFMRSLLGRMKLGHARGTINQQEEEDAQDPLRTLKSIFPGTPLAKHTPLDILITAPSEDSTRPRAVIVRDLGSVENNWIAREIILAYFEGDGLSPARPGKGRRGDSVGPFALGVQPSVRNGEKVKKWAELSPGGKVTRAAARSTNFTVILIGAGFSVMLFYALTSELFSKNSPTVLYGQACDRIDKSPKVATYLQGPLNFHNNPPSSTRPRHRNRHVSSQIFVDSSGRDHMILNFYVKGKPPGSTPFLSKDPSDSYIDAMTSWAGDKLAIFSELDFDEAVEWTKDRATSMMERSKGLFRYLSGAPMAPLSLPEPLHMEAKETKKPEGTGWSLIGMFSGLRGTRTNPSESTRSNGELWTEGEVHADLVRNDDGYFEFRYLLIDIPNSASRNPLRVFVERSRGVRENEPTIRWSS